MVGREVALITDTHFGVRKGSQIFHDYFEKFFRETFFPELDKRDITTVIHLGDCFDVRKGIDYWSLNWAKTHFFNPLKERGIHLHMIVGNHDIFYKQSLKINSPGLNLAEYDNITIYDVPNTVEVEGVEIFMVTWNWLDFMPIRSINASMAQILSASTSLKPYFLDTSISVPLLVILLISVILISYIGMMRVRQEGSTFST